MENLETKKILNHHFWDTLAELQEKYDYKKEDEIEWGFDVGL